MAPAPKVNGRPRSLTLDDVLDTAIEMGIGSISMTALAARLNVATATIYNYVTSRDELVRLAARRQVDWLRFDDIGGDWAELMRGHARRFFDYYFAEPQMIVQHMHGLISPDVNLDYLDALLAALVKRGFSIAAAYRLYTGTNFIVAGAIVRAAHVRSLQQRRQSPGRIVKQSLAARAADDLPYLRACNEAIGDAYEFAWEEVLERLLESFAKDVTLNTDTGKNLVQNIAQHKPAKVPVG
jgi:AcrR family transcriptional regulator